MEKSNREKAAETIFKSGSFKKDFVNGFQIALHDNLPEAPRSPFYLNLRPQGIKGGVLTEADFRLMAMSMDDLYRQARLYESVAGRPICSIPAAGDPFLDQLLAVSPIAITARRIRLEKFMVDGKRQLSLSRADQRANRDTILVDDLVTSMLTKQLAIDAIEAYGGTVTDLIVFLDRSANAKQDLLSRGVRLHAVWEFPDLMEWALGQGYLKRGEYETIMEYPDRLAAYQRSVGYQP